MENASLGFKNKILSGALFALVILFAFSLFKNIQYPLLWNDEAEAAMHAGRVLDYGYPKVHDGKNTVNISNLPAGIGVDEKTDAYLGHVWGQYYFCAAGEFFARKISDIYVKTAAVRIPFAAIGFMGVVLMALSVINLFGKRLSDKLLFSVIFAFFELLSVSLVLHLREVRHYSLAVFLSAAILYLYINYRFARKISLASYFFLMAAFLFLLFNVFPPTYFIFLAVIGLSEFPGLFRARGVKNFIANISPLLVSFVASIPILAFFKIFSSGRGDFTKTFHISPAVYWMKIASVLNFFLKYEFLALVLIVKIVLAFVKLYLRRSGALEGPGQENMLRMNVKAQASNFLSLFFAVYVLAIARLPVFIIYERYYIILQPVLVIILLLDASLAFDYISGANYPAAMKARLKAVLLSLISVTFILDGSGKLGALKSHIYEISHRYRGPLDFVIPYIKSNYEKPEKLVIATNYEEYSYMYYLGSKTIIGYGNSDIYNDLEMRPDIIVFRKAYPDNAYIFNGFLQKDKYKKISFPCFDYPVNNIPELNVALPPHLYKTRLAENDDERLDVYLKVK
ncbi:MAG: hypothetical protein V1869_06640 [Candidatus Omnitrophota bacterium]